MDRHEICIPRTVNVEGGLVNHPRDPGGWTNYGITIRTAQRIGLDVDGDGDVDPDDIKKLTRADAIEVYRRFYWAPAGADLLPIGVDFAVFDFGVNSGPGTAVKMLQEILGVAKDGHVGPVTLNAALARDPSHIVLELCAARLKYLRDLKDKEGRDQWAVFGDGWKARVERVQAEAIADIEGREIAPTVPSGRSLRFGMSSTEVELLQMDLAELGYFAGRVDGKFGQLTRAAVLAFQADNALETDGRVGPATRAALDAAEPRAERDVTEDDLEASGIIADARATGRVGSIVGAGGCIAGVDVIAENADEIAEAAQQAQGAIDTVGGVLASVSGIVVDHWPAFLAVGIAVAGWAILRTISKDTRARRVADARQYRNLGR